MITKGVGVVFDTDFEDGYRSDMQIVMVATWDGTSGEVFTNINLSERSVGCAIWTFDDEAWENSKDLLVGHNLHDKLNGNTFDLLQEIKQVSADYLQNEGKRFHPKPYFWGWTAAATAAATEEFSGRVQTPSPSHPGIKYPVRAPPLTPIINVRYFLTFLLKNDEEFSRRIFS